MSKRGIRLVGVPPWPVDGRPAVTSGFIRSPHDDGQPCHVTYGWCWEHMCRAKKEHSDA